MRLSLLLASAAVLSGCLSSSPTVRTYSANADNLRVRYAGDQGQIADRLLERGCTAQDEAQYLCPIESPSGPMIVALGFSAPVASSRTQEQPETTQEYVTEREPEPERYLPDGETYSVAPTRGADHSSVRPSVGRAPTPVLGLHARAQVFDGDTPVLLAGDEAEAVREALYGLLIQDLPVVSAYYLD